MTIPKDDLPLVPDEAGAHGENSHLRQQVEANAGTADAWTLFANHRRHVTDLIASRAVSNGRLCVLGAGNCNDLDLEHLGPHFAAIHLLDLDGDALARSLQRNRAVRDRLLAFGDIDIARTAAAQPPELPCGTGFDVVLSATVFTQIVDGIVRRLGPGHRATLDAVLAARRQHLRLMLELLAQGGSAVFVTDFVASETFPALAHLPDEALADTMRALTVSRNFFAGTNPAAIVEDIRRQPELRSRVRSISQRGPWRWRLSRERQRLVYALVLERA